MGHEAPEGFIDREISAFLERAREEARIEQMQYRMLDAADIFIDRQKMIDACFVKCLFAVRRAEARKIPGGFKERVERVGFTRGGFAASGAGDVLPGGVMRKRVAGCVERHIFGQRDGQVFFRHRHRAAGIAIDDGNRAAPVALA